MYSLYSHLCQLLLRIRKVNEGRRYRAVGRQKRETVDSLASRDLSNKVTFDKRSEGNGRVSYTGIWEKNISG